MSSDVNECKPLPETRPLAHAATEGLTGIARRVIPRIVNPRFLRQTVSDIACRVIQRVLFLSRTVSDIACRVIKRVNAL